MLIRNRLIFWTVACQALGLLCLATPLRGEISTDAKAARGGFSESTSVTLPHKKQLAASRPLWELALGAGALNHGYYTGTEQTNNYVFPIILPIYRGAVFKSDDKGMRALLIDEPRYNLGISLDFNPALESDEIELRQNMPDVEHLLQVGPALEYTLSKTPGEHWTVKLPLRAAFEFEADRIRGRGFNISPTLSYVHQHSDHPWKQGFSVSLQWGSPHYHDIYYGVQPEYATDARPTYAPGSGYAGARLQWAFSARQPRHLMVFFVRYDYIEGAVFEDSPLVETDHNITAGFLFSYSIVQSKARVTR